MKRIIVLIICLITLVVGQQPGTNQQQKPGGPQGKPPEPPKKKTMEEALKNTKEISGFLTMRQDAVGKVDSRRAYPPGEARC